MLGSSIRQFGRSLYPVTWSLPFPISNPVLVPPEYAYRNVVIGTICNTQCSPNAIPIGQAFCGSFRTFQYCISFWLFFRKYYSLTWKVLQDILWLGKSYKLFRQFFFLWDTMKSFLNSFSEIELGQQRIWVPIQKTEVIWSWILFCQELSVHIL